MSPKTPQQYAEKHQRRPASYRQRASMRHRLSKWKGIFKHEFVRLDRLLEKQGMKPHHK